MAKHRKAELKNWNERVYPEYREECVSLFGAAVRQRCSSETLSTLAQRANATSKVMPISRKVLV